MALGEWDAESEMGRVLLKAKDALGLSNEDLVAMERVARQIGRATGNSPGDVMEALITTANAYAEEDRDGSR